MLPEQATKHFILRQLETLPPQGLAEVAQFIEFLQYQSSQPVKTRKTGARKPAAFGIWADRAEAQNPAQFAQSLRQKMESRQDG